MFEMTNNKVMLRGRLQNDFVFFEEREGKKLYKGTIVVKSLKRRYEDKIDVLIEEKLLLKKENDKKVEIRGKLDLNRGRCDILVKNLHYLKEEDEPDLNFVFLEAYLIRKPCKRKKNTILSVALNQKSSASYINCICTGLMVDRVNGFQVSEKKIKINGKIVTKRSNKRNIKVVLVDQIER